jgi:beta-galactosidase
MNATLEAPQSGIPAGQGPKAASSSLGEVSVLAALATAVMACPSGIAGIAGIVGGDAGASDSGAYRSADGGADAGASAEDGGRPGGADAGAADAGAADAGRADAGSADAGDGSVSQLVPAYNGARGQSFNDGWKFQKGDASGAEKAGFDDSGWRSLSVPHDWSIEQEFNKNSKANCWAGYLDGGVGWYRKTFALDASLSGQRILIGFDGVYMNSEVWINGTSLGTRPNGYSTFEYDLTPHVRFGGASNLVAVRVDNEQPNSRWYTGSGIYRNVWLTELDPVHIPNSGVFVTTPSVTAASATVSVSTEVQNQSTASQPVTVTTTLYDPSGSRATDDTTSSVDVARDATSTFRQSLTVASPKLWSTTSPALYQVEVEVKVGGAVADTYRVPLGIRSFQFDPASGFSLNGQNMKLRGVCMHHDLGALGTALSRRALERQVLMMKAMGANAIRTSHNPPAPELLEICDREGILVMDEAFDVWEMGKEPEFDYHVHFKDWAQIDIQAQVRRDRNHPSVILWSIGNEIQGASVSTASNLIQWVKAIDSTRPVTWACNNMGDRTNQEIAKLLDVQGYNYQEQFYDGDRSSHPDWKIYGSETCSAVRSRGIYHSDGNVTNADMQCSSYDDNANWHSPAWQGYEWDVSRPFIGGQFIWTGFDYIGEPTPYKCQYPAKGSYFGIVDTAGFPKDTYYFYMSRWTAAPMIHVLPHWNWSPGTNVRVHVYTSCESAELFVNGKSQGAKTFGSGATRLEWNSVPWEAGTLRVDGKIGGAVVAHDEVKTAGAPAAVMLSVDRTTIAADGRDLAFVTADIVDSNGVFVPTATNAVEFTVTGPGKVAGTDNGNAIDVTSYVSSARNAFSGKALAIIRSTGAAGSIQVKSSSAGLSADSVTITAR